MKTRELDEILKRFGRDRAVKEVSELQEGHNAEGKPCGTSVGWPSLRAG